MKFNEREIDILSTAMFVFEQFCRRDNIYMMSNEEGEANYDENEITNLTSKMIKLSNEGKNRQAEEDKSKTESHQQDHWQPTQDDTDIPF